MIEALHRPPFHPESAAYGDAVVGTVAEQLRAEIEAFAASASPELAIEIKDGGLDPESPVTYYDKVTEERIGAFYAGTNVKVAGEEKVVAWPADKLPTLKAHTDPIDGTVIFIEHVKALIAWYQLPEAERGPRPICGSMVSVGATALGNPTPLWGAIAAPFMAPDGVVRWRTGHNGIVQRVEPDGTQERLLRVDEDHAATLGKTIVAASYLTDKVLRGPLEEAGFRVVRYESAVAGALSLMDPTLLSRLQPSEHDPQERVAGIVTRNAKNWDVAATVALANQLGYSVTTTTGQPRRFEEGSRSALFAASPAIGQTILQTIAPHIR